MATRSKAYAGWRYDSTTDLFSSYKNCISENIAGVRIKEIFKKDTLLGFSYETLHGHIEKGISSFVVEIANEHINFTIHTYSNANNLLLDLFSPLFSSPYQDYCTVKALQNMEDNFKKENPAL
jgi:uncharacterized protein (UPF0548 family)